MRTDLGMGGQGDWPPLCAASESPWETCPGFGREQCADYSLETSLQACEIHTLFFIISFKTCGVFGPSLSASVTQRKGEAWSLRHRAPCRGKKREVRRMPSRSQETEREVVPGHSGGTGCWQGPHVPDMAYRLECWYS